MSDFLTFGTIRHLIDSLIEAITLQQHQEAESREELTQPEMEQNLINGLWEGLLGFLRMLRNALAGMETSYVESGMNYGRNVIDQLSHRLMFMYANRLIVLFDVLFVLFVALALLVLMITFFLFFGHVDLGALEPRNLSRCRLLNQHPHLRNLHNILNGEAPRVEANKPNEPNEGAVRRPAPVAAPVPQRPHENPEEPKEIDVKALEEAEEKRYKELPCVATTEMLDEIDAPAELFMDYE